MRRARICAAAAAILTVLLLQATVVAPASGWVPVSLPVVLVAAVGLVDGPAAGMSFGFAAGLTADLGSHHPAGVLALSWLGVGLLCGLVADRRSLRRDAITAGLVCGVATSVVTLLLALLRAGGSPLAAVEQLVPTMAVDAVLALGVLAVVRPMLHSDTLRAPSPVFTALAVGRDRA